MEHHNYKNIDKLEEKMRSYQSIPYALIGGFVLAILGAVIWAAVVVGSGYQVGIIAILIGIIVGVGVRYFGAGFDPIFGIIGGSFTLLSCVLGSLFTQIGFSMSTEGMSLMQTLSFLNVNNVISIITESFSIMDLVFYGIAVYEGVKFSIRTLEPNTDPNDSLEPPFSSLRGPLVGTISAVLLFGFIYMGVKEPSASTYFHETGEKMSVGAYAGGVEHGAWEYFYTNGQIESKGSYEHGKQVGEWNIYYENGQLGSRTSYTDGLENGESASFYQDGKKGNISMYKNGRLNGPSETFHENGISANKGEYLNDREQDKWSYHYDNGKPSAMGYFDKGEYVGEWKYWYENGNLKEILEHEDTENYKILEAYDINSNVMVKNGNGTYTYSYEDGSLMTKGAIKDGEKFGEWNTYDPKGKLTEEGVYENGIFKIVNSWNSKGQHVKDGNGIYKTYSDRNGNLIESGEIISGLKSGKWVFYDDSLQKKFAETSFDKGLLDGETIQYYDDGSPSVLLSYKKDKLNGNCVWYHFNGNKSSEVNHVDGLKEGIQTFWNNAGVKTKEEVYQQGELIETRQ